MIGKMALLVCASVLTLGACGRDTAKPSSEEAVPAVAGTTWQWQDFQDSAEGDEARVVDVANPSKYTLTLGPDARARIQADCNQLSWTYALDASRLTFDPLGPSTLAACGEDSLDQLYLSLLGETVTWVMADGMLHLNLKMDSGNMVFAAAEP